MIYDYNTYYIHDCVSPLAFVVLFAVVVIKIVLSLLKQCANLSLWEVIKRNSIPTFFVVLFAFLICINSLHLLRGGIWLFWEKESQAVQITGVVDDIIEIDVLTGSRYDVDENSGLGMAIVNNEKKYYVTTSGDLKTGDSVILKILPKSCFVLSVEKTVS